MQRSVSSEVCVVEKGKWKNEDLNPVCRENAKRDGASWWQCLPGIRAGTALGGDFAACARFAAVLTSSCPSLLCSCLHCNSESFPFAASCFLSFGEIHGWEFLEMCVTKFDLFIVFYLLLIEWKWVHEGSWWMSKLILQLLTKSWKNSCRSIAILWHGYLFTITWNEICHLIF